MTRDYAKPKSPRRNTRGNKQTNTSHALRWLISGILLGSAGTWGFFYLQQNGTQKLVHGIHHAYDNIQQKLNKPNKTSTNKSKTAPDNNMPSFDFYTVLPDQKVPQVRAPQKPQTAAPVNPVPNKTTQAAANTQYIIQVAAFKRAQDADKLKAELTLIGFNVTVSTNTIQGVTWHRVTIGPFPSKQAAETAQQRLHASNMQGLIKTN
jgi:cell division protein FtsN